MGGSHCGPGPRVSGRPRGRSTDCRRTIVDDSGAFHPDRKKQGSERQLRTVRTTRTIFPAVPYGSPYSQPFSKVRRACRVSTGRAANSPIRRGKSTAAGSGCANCVQTERTPAHVSGISRGLPEAPSGLIIPWFRVRIPEAPSRTSATATQSPVPNRVRGGALTRIDKQCHLFPGRRDERALSALRPGPPPGRTAGCGTPPSCIPNI